MSLEEFKQADATKMPVGKLLYMIGKGYHMYVNHHLSQLNINVTQLHLLFEISQDSNSNQEKIAQRCNINKGAVARSIKKLEDKGIVKRQIDENNRRQNKLSLTDKGEETLRQCKEILNEWEDKVILDKGYIEKELIQKILKDIAVKTIELNQGECNEQEK